MNEAEGSEMLRLKDLAEEERPREKLLQRGRAVLSDEELIAIFLRTGLPGCNVLELAARLKRSAGSLVDLGRMEAAEIMQCCRGIGAAKAATLAAGFELGKRSLEAELQREPMESAAMVYQYLSNDMQHFTQENMVVLLLDIKRRLIRKRYIAKGSASNVIVHPRDVFRDAILANAHAVILAHNHPSGDPRPSKNDEKLTASLLAAADTLHICLMDHVIIGSYGNGRLLPYYSFRENGRIV